MNKQTKFILAVGLQLIIIFTIIIFKLLILSGGTTVMLQIRPVDPRDPLRGDYMTFSYYVSEVPRYYFKSLPRNGETVYVPLRQSGKYYIAASGASSRKPTGGGQLFIKGVVVSGGRVGSTNLARGMRFSGDSVRILYGIEEFFIPEGTGRGFSASGGDNYAAVVIDGDGNAVLKQLYIKGNPWP